MTAKKTPAANAVNANVLQQVAACEEAIIKHAQGRAESATGYAALFLALAKTARAGKLTDASFAPRLDALKEAVKACNGADYITVNVYASQARRVVAAPDAEYAKAVQAGNATLKTIAEACPKVTSAGRKVSGSAGKSAGKDVEPANDSGNTPAQDSKPAPQGDIFARLDADLRELSRMMGSDKVVAGLLVEMADAMEVIQRRANKKAA